MNVKIMKDNNNESVRFLVNGSEEEQLIPVSQLVEGTRCRVGYGRI